MLSIKLFVSLCILTQVMACTSKIGFCLDIGETCGIDDVCATGVCFKEKCAIDNHGAHCDNDSQCVGFYSTLYCKNAVCVPLASTNDGCQSGSDCLSGKCSDLVCQPTVNGESCVYDSQCSTDHWCYNNVCISKISPNQSCNKIGTCLSKMFECIGNKCTRLFSNAIAVPCVHASDCMAGMTCSKSIGRCSPLPPGQKSQNCNTCDRLSQECCCDYSVSEDGISQCCAQNADISMCVGEEIALSLCLDNNQCYRNDIYKYGRASARDTQCIRRECYTEINSLVVCQSKALGLPSKCKDYIGKHFEMKYSSTRECTNSSRREVAAAKNYKLASLFDFLSLMTVGLVVTFIIFCSIVYVVAQKIRSRRVQWPTGHQE